MDLLLYVDFTQCGNLRNFVSHFFPQISWKFRETNALKAFYSKMALEMAVFCIFGANLRKFDLFGLLEEGLDFQNPFKPLTPTDPLKH